jgi:hypothetical protein
MMTTTHHVGSLNLPHSLMLLFAVRSTLGGQNSWVAPEDSRCPRVPPGVPLVHGFRQMYP